MVHNPDIISKFQQMYFEKFNLQISKEEAESDLSGLMELIRITYFKELKSE